MTTGRDFSDLTTQETKEMVDRINQVFAEEFDIAPVTIKMFWQCFRHGYKAIRDTTGDDDD